MAAPRIDAAPLLRLLRTSAVDDASIASAAALDAALRRPGSAVLFSSDASLPLFPPSTGRVDAMAAMHAAADRVFAMAEAEKRLRLPRARGPVTRGYLPVAAESGSPELVEAKEAWAFGREIDAAGNALEARNAWPDDEAAPGFRDACIAGLDALEELRRAVTAGLSLAAYDDPHFLERECCGPEADRLAMVRLAQYVPHALAGDAAGKQIVGSSPHTDWGFLTLVHQPSSTPGLELFLDGAWHAVPAAPDEVFVQAGDYLSLLSKERWHSPLHRVLHPPGSERRSAVYFSYPRFGCPVPDTSAGEGRISLTKAQGERGGGAARSGTFGEWMVAKWAEVQRG